MNTTSKKILGDIRESLFKEDAAKLRERALYYYEGIGILTSEGFIQGFDTRSDELLPTDEDFKRRLFEFCYQVAEGIEQNQYMMNCISRVGKQGMWSYVERIQQDPDINLVDCIVYAYCLEQFTLLCISDHTLTDSLMQETAEIYSFKNLMRNMVKQRSLFVPIKAISVRKSMEILQRQIATKHVSLRDCRISMKGNIIEAVVEDAANGRFANALAGLVLLVSYLPYSGETPSNSYIKGEQRLDEQPNMDRWGDLYRVWNFAFVSNEFQSCGFVGAKLLIPSVNGVAIDNEFRHNRVLSLYGMINLFTRGGKYTEFTKTQHRDKEFARKLGWANLENALSYLVDLRTK